MSFQSGCNRNLCRVPNKYRVFYGFMLALKTIHSSAEALSRTLRWRCTMHCSSDQCSLPDLPGPPLPADRFAAILNNIAHTYIRELTSELAWLYPVPFLPISCVLANSIRDMRFILFSILFTMLVMVTSTLTGPLDRAIDKPRMPFSWEQSREIDLHNLRLRMDSLEKGLQEYRSSKLDPADKATMLEELRTQSLEAIALLEKCIQLYGIEWSWSAHSVWLQEMATNVFDDYHNAIESVASKNLFGFRPRYPLDFSFNHLLFWEIVGKIDVVTSAPLEQRKLIGLIQERAFSRFRRWLVRQQIEERIHPEGEQTLQSYIPHFYDQSYRRALKLPESFDWNFPADALIRDNRHLALEEEGLRRSYEHAYALRYGVPDQVQRDAVWEAMVKCDSFIYANVDSEPSNWSEAISVGDHIYTRLMVMTIHESLDYRAEELKKNIPPQFVTPLFGIELSRLIYWNKAINAGRISNAGYQDSKNLQMLLATVSSSESIKNLLSKWKDIENFAYVKIMKEFDMLGRHIYTLEKQRDPVPARMKVMPAQPQ